MQIRPGELRDLEALNDVYNHYVRTSPATFDIDEVTLEGRRTWFEEFGGRYKLYVATEDESFIGFAYSGKVSPRKAYDTSVMTSVYVADEALGRGVGTLLYEALFGSIATKDLHRAYAGITIPNAASVALHAKFGFTQVAHYSEQGRKFGRYWDVAWFEKAL